MTNAAWDHVHGARTERSPEQVVSHVRGLIERKTLRPGDRLPAERDLAIQIGVSRPTVRAGLRALAAMGVVRSKHGSGTYIQDGPPTLGSEPLSFLAALHGFTRDEMYEARRILEVGAAGVAAERAGPEHLATLADEVANLFASMDNPQGFLVHDINFHRAVAAATGNPIVAAVVEMISALYYERRRQTAERATDRNLHDAAEMHRRIYQAIRAGDPDRARAAMNEHLRQASAYQAREPQNGSAPAASAGDAPPATTAPSRSGHRRSREPQHGSAPAASADDAPPATAAPSRSGHRRRKIRKLN
jgi:GntR family transcriptional repressor for pyruvate dehydrogenase complex